MTNRERDERIRKAEARRYRKPIASELNWYRISEHIGDILQDCGDIRWMTEDEEQLIDFLDGDEEQAFEFQMAFGSLTADCEQMIEDMEEIRRYDFMGANVSDDGAPLFDLFFPAVKTGDDYFGYDEEISEYFSLTGYQYMAAIDEAKKKLKRLTKDQLLDLAGMALNVARNYVSIVYRFDTLKDCIDILKGKNDGLLATVKGLEAAWKAWDEASNHGRWPHNSKETELDRQLMQMPERLWIE